MDRPDRLAQLQEVIGFFEQGLSAERLMGQLAGEERRDKRRQLLDLLVVHGQQARALARAKRVAQHGPSANNFARRNWIYLLRHIPRAPGEPPEGEIEAVARCAAPGQPGFLVKEALTHLSQTHHPRVAEALVTLLAGWEAELDDAAARGAREHGRARLAELGSQDLATSPDVVATLTTIVREGLPRGVLSRFVSRQDHDLAAIVDALAGTRTPQVRELLEQLSQRLASHEAGKAAAQALEAWLPAPGPLQPKPATPRKPRARPRRSCPSSRRSCARA